MLTLKIAIRRKEKRHDGKVNVKIAVIYARKTRYLRTEYYIYPKEFSRLNAKTKAELRLYIAALYGKVKNIPITDIPGLMRLLRDKHTTVNLLTVFDNKIANVSNVNYKKCLSDTRSVIKRYGIDTDFINISAAWLHNLCVCMQSLSPNSQGVHLRNVRTVLNEAITLGYTTNYPFRGFKIPRQRTVKRNLTVGQLTCVARCHSWATDMFMLSFYLLGINFRDLAFVKEIHNGRIEYIRSKGKKHYSVKVLPEAMQIINRHKGKRYLLNIMDRYSDYRYAVRAVNDGLQEMFPGLTTYWARHSVASVMSSIGISHDVIARALGHSTDNVMTSIYINFDEARVDEAQRRMIDAILPSTAPVRCISLGELSLN